MRPGRRDVLRCGLVLLWWAALVLAPAGPLAARDLRQITVAGGCFWCVERNFDEVRGVVATESGYTGGLIARPSYRQVASQTTGHYEAVRVTYDAEKVTLAALLDYFFRSVDPTDAGGQFCDRGSPYRTAIFVGSEEERRIARSVRRSAARLLGEKIVTPILSAETFWPAEKAHQNYYKTHPITYWFYRKRCGRDRRVRAIWGDLAAAVPARRSARR